MFAGERGKCLSLDSLVWSNASNRNVPLRPVFLRDWRVVCTTMPFAHSLEVTQSLSHCLEAIRVFSVPFIFSVALNRGPLHTFHSTLENCSNFPFKRSHFLIIFRSFDCIYLYADGSAWSFSLIVLFTSTIYYFDFVVSRLKCTQFQRIYLRFAHNSICFH